MPPPHRSPSRTRPGHEPDNFAGLDVGLPLALLPVRVEARYLPRRNPTHLHVRVFPDVIHADAHRPWLSARELAAGINYWTSVWGQTDASVISEARRWLAAQATPHRALWVATMTRPSNLDDADPSNTAPQFPELPAEERSQPVRAALLPDSWEVRLYDADLNLAHTAFGDSIVDGLAVAPTLSSAGTDATHPDTGAILSAPLGFLAGQDLLWTVDFGQAEAVGMGLRIPIGSVPDPVGALIVMGARAGRTASEEGDLLDIQLASHWYTRGLDIVPQGTPTNNTDAGRSGISLSAPDIDALFEREESSRPLAPAGRALLIATDASMLYRIPAADASSLALGRIRENVFDKVAHADWGEGAAAWAMNSVIGYATLGAYLNGPLAMVDGSVATGDDTPTFRDWYVDWVRGGATLPVLRCGDQPYGLLPITHRPTEHAGATEFENLYEHHLTQFRALWTDALPVAALDPDATDSRPSGGTEIGEASIIAEVLGAVPHPTSLQLRAATDHLPTDTAAFLEGITAIESALLLDNSLFPEHSTHGTESLLNRYWDQRERWIVGLPDESPPVMPPDITAQLVHLDLFRAEALHAPDVEPHSQPTSIIIRNVIDLELRPLLEVHQAATNAVPTQLWDWSESGGVSAGNVIRLVGTTYDDTAVPVGDLVTTDGDVAEIRDLIVSAIDLLDEAEAGSVPPLQRDRLVSGEAPLLAHLIDVNCRTVPTPEIAPVRVALRVLLALIDSPAVASPEGALERLLRESLGLAMYRIDAWVTAIAAKRLAEKRQKRPFGLQIGGYGWLLDLAKSDDPTSQGFVHAPSLAHAATAAVLRSGWSAYGTSSGATPLSVDLSSDRVRGAQWVLDGVRNGQDLSELLGARFERYLHDARLDVWIETVRLAALAARGDTRPPSAIVDGLLLARAWADVAPTDAEADLRSALGLATAPTGDPADDEPRAGVRRALRRIAADLDAVADLTMAQSVHSLLQDNPEAASAALAITGGGDSAVPRIDVLATQRDEVLVSHRVVAMWAASPDDVDDSHDSEVSPLRAAEPRLVRWLESILPPADRVVADIQINDPATGASMAESISFADVGINTVEAALLASSTPTQGRSRLGRSVIGAAAGLTREHTNPAVEVVVDLAAPISATGQLISVDEFGLVAAALLEAVGRARPLRAGDLVLPAVDISTVTVDAAELDGRVTRVESIVDGLILALGADLGPRFAALGRCAAIGIHGAVRAMEAGATDEAVTPVVAALSNRLTAAPDPPSDPAEAALARLRRLAGGRVPLLPVFTPVADPDRVASAASSQRQSQVAGGGHSWLRQSARVRADLGAMFDFLLLAESVTDRPPAPYGLAQMPNDAGPWAATDRPADDTDRLSVVSLTGAAALGIDNRPVAGLLVDSWTEGIPRNQYQTGIAVHFDAPTARPPQAVLLSVVDAERGFSADEVADQLLHTIELAKVRAVDPSTLSTVGHYLPAVFVPDDVVVSGGVA